MISGINNIKLVVDWVELIEQYLPEDRPAASHRPGPGEPCLNYKLGIHLSVTQRNQCTVEGINKTYMGNSICKHSGRLPLMCIQRKETSSCMCTMVMNDCTSIPIIITFNSDTQQGDYKKTLCLSDEIFFEKLLPNI